MIREFSGFYSRKSSNCVNHGSEKRVPATRIIYKPLFSRSLYERGNIFLPKKLVL